MKRLGVICLAAVLGLVLAGAAHGRVTRIVIVPEDAADLVSVAEASEMLR